MPYLMTDAAAGSSAANTMMQNMGEAPYAFQEGAAKGQEAQIKLQQEQAKLQQDQANVEKTKLANIVQESAIQVDKQKIEAVAKLQGTAGWDQKSASDQADAMAKAIMAFDPDQADKLLTAAATHDLREAQAKAKELDNTREEVAKADAVMQAMSDDKAAETFSKLPPEAQKQVIDKVGKENWDAMSNKEKKAVVHNLMESTNQKVQEQRMAMELEKTKLRDAMELERAAQQGRDRIAAREAAGTRGNNMWRQVNQELDTIDKRSQKKIGDLEDAVDKARTAAQDLHIFKIGGYDTEDPETHEKATFRNKDAYDKYLEAVKQRDKALSKKYDDEEEVIRTLPREVSDLRDRELRRIENQRATLTVVPGVDVPKKIKGREDDKKDVPSNTKNLSSEDKDALDWANANPDDPRAAKIKARLGG